jgi:hypothetical protein
MKINNLNAVMEAMRMSNSEKISVQKLEPYFKIGIEYEFLVSEIDEIDESDYDHYYDVYTEEAYDEYDVNSYYFIDLMSDIVHYRSAEEFLDSDSLRDIVKLILNVQKELNPKRGDWFSSVVNEFHHGIQENIIELTLQTSASEEEIRSQLETCINYIQEELSDNHWRSKNDIVSALHDTDEYKELVHEYASQRAIEHRGDQSERNRVATEKAKEIVEYEFGEDFDEMIEEVTEDGSLDGGAEVVTKPLSFSDTKHAMDIMFDIIDKHGETDSSCGMHVNISHLAFAKDSRPNPLRIAVLMDSDFFQNTRNNIISKFPERGGYTKSISKYISSEMRKLVEAYIKGGIEDAESHLINYINSTSEKYTAINWTSMLGVDEETRRLEFRFFGGKDYHKRKQEILNDITYIMHVIHMVVSGKYNREDYLRGLVKMLDTSARYKFKLSFSDLVNNVKKYGSFDNFLRSYESDKQEKDSRREKLNKLNTNN